MRPTGVVRQVSVSGTEIAGEVLVNRLALQRSRGIAKQRGQALAIERLPSPAAGRPISANVG
jgi:hypothetical protein